MSLFYALVADLRFIGGVVELAGGAAEGLFLVLLEKL